jgi:hypothetical protein
MSTRIIFKNPASDVREPARTFSTRTLLRGIEKPYLVGLGFKRHGNLGCEAWHELAEFDSQVDESGETLHVQQAVQILAFRAA